jgi:hypothetical protein
MTRPSWPSCAERRTTNKQTFASMPPANESVSCLRRSAFQLSAVVRSLHAGPAASMMRCCTSTPGPGTTIGRMRSPATSGRGRRHLDWPFPPSRQRPFTRRVCFCQSNLHRTERPHQRRLADCVELTMRPMRLAAGARLTRQNSRVCRRLAVPFGSFSCSALSACTVHGARSAPVLVADWVDTPQWLSGMLHSHTAAD